MGRNLTNLAVSESFQYLLQISGSNVQDGLGSDITGSLLITASFADNAFISDFATTASFATNANTAISSSYALTASFALNAGVTVDTGSLLVTASAALNTITFTKGDASTFAITVDTGSVDTGSLLTTASISDSLITFTKGNASTFSIEVNNVSSSISASHALNADNAISSSYALTASFAENVVPFDSSSLLVTASIVDATTTFTKGDGSTFSLVTNNVVNADSASLAANATSASFATNANTAISSSFATSASQAQNAVSSSFATSASFADTANNATTSTSSSYATTASFAENVANGINISASSITATSASFQNLSAVSASFGYVKTVTGSAVIIGDEFIILNADTPTAPFAGIKVYDTGSASTASFEWNGNGDYWILVDETGQSSAILTGNTGSKGSEIFPTLNTIVKGGGENRLIDSSITDDGTTVKISGGDQLEVTGSAQCPIKVKSTTTGGGISFEDNTTTNNLTVGVGALGNDLCFRSNGNINTRIISTGLIVTGSVTATVGFTGSLQGTASFATSSSFADTSISSSFTTTAISASHAVNADNAISASFTTTAISASHAINADNAISASFTTTAISASHAINADISISSSFATTASFVADVVKNSADIYATPKVEQVITLTQAEYNGLTPDPNTLYIISGSIPIDFTSFASTGSNTFVGNQIFSGSVKGEVNALSISSETASLDCSTGNFYTLTLVSGSTTFVDPSNIASGQTINLKVKQASVAFGSISFASSVKQVSGSLYTPTETADAEDIITLISFDDTNLYLSNVNNLV